MPAIKPAAALQQTKVAPKLQQRAKLLKIRNQLGKCANEWLAQNAPRLHFTPTFLKKLKAAGITKTFRTIFGTMLIEIAEREGYVKYPKLKKGQHSKPTITNKRRVVDDAVGELITIAPQIIKNKAELKNVIAFLKKAKTSTFDNLGKL